MKKFTIKGMVQKTIISLLVVIMVNFTIPVHVNAGIISWAGNTIGEAILTFTAFLGDTVVGGLHKFVLGTEDMFSSVMLPSDNPTVTDGDLKGDATGDAIELDGSSIGTDGVGIPNIMVCPEYIFENRIPLLDANFVNPGQYIQGGNSNNKTTGTITGGALKTVIASWYRAFRNIAIVGLLSILVYIGIRILLGSTSQDKAKYKERLVDWLVGLCLVFVMHYIMAGTMMITENITYMLSKSIDSTQYDVVVTGKLTSDGAKDTVSVKENLTGYVRLMAQTDNLSDSFAYTLLYIIMIIFTIMFLITYIKRVLYMAFFTMIAPLVAMTYPLDKIADGKAQGFTMWFKEYMMNALIQPVHLILYSVFVGSAAELSKSNLIYSIVAIAFLLPAEKFIKKMFRLDRAETTGALGAVAGGALAMQGMQKIAKAGSTTSVGKGKSSGENNNGKIRYGGNDVSDAWKKNNGEIDNRMPNNESENDVIEKNENDNLGIASSNENIQGNAALESLDNTAIDQDREDNNNLNYANNLNSLENDDNKEFENNENDEDDRTLGEYFTDTTGLKTPAEKFRQLREGAHQLPDKAKNKIKESNIYNKINSHNKIPKPVRRAITGVARIPLGAAKSVWKHKGKIGRTALKTLGAGTFGVMGAAAGIATGDFSKVGTYAAAGAMAGRAIGNNTANIASYSKDALMNGTGSLRQSYEEGAYGINKAKDMQLQREYEKNRRLHMNDAEQKEKAKEIANKLNKSGVYANRQPISYKEVQNKMFDYKSAGITDDDQITKGLMMEEKHKEFDQSQIISIMKNANKISDDTILDDKKRNSYRESVKAKYGDKAGEQFTGLVAEAKGLDKFYNKKISEEKVAHKNMIIKQNKRKKEDKI